MPLGYNKVLGDPAKPAALRPHRVVIAHWPTTIKDPRTRTFDTLAHYIASAGYEGAEFSIYRLTEFFPGDSEPVMARKTRRALEQVGLRNFGSTLHLEDAQLREIHWLKHVTDQIKIIQDTGGEYVSVQFFLHPQYMDTGGAYREDETYIRWCADRVAQIREQAWSAGMNFYLEVHIARITEDPAACCRILELVTCELNGDLSHLLYRSITQGKYVEKILEHVSHTHVRMARKHGDLSAVVEDPKADWEQRGVTWQMFKLMQPALARGLSSRAIVGETGPMHLVTDSLTQDAVLVPLYRAMARYADAGAQGMTMSVNSPEDLKPWA